MNKSLLISFILVASLATTLAQTSFDSSCVWWLSSISTNETDCSRTNPCSHLKSALDFANASPSPCPSNETRYIYLIPDGVYYNSSGIRLDYNYDPNNAYSTIIVSSASPVVLTQNVTLPLPPAPMNAVIDASNTTFHARFFLENTNYTFIGITFKNANASGNIGFPIFIYPDTIAVNFISCTFQDNFGLKGGLLYWNPIKSSFINNCTFINNIGGPLSMGGAIFIKDNAASLSIDNSTFTNNNASVGGALYVEDSKVVVSNSNFTFNRAFNGSGGGAYVQSVGVSVGSNWKNIVFSNNSAINGGALFDKLSTLEYANIKFELNYASFNGGAVNLQDTLSSIVQSTFHQNSAFNGGAVFTFDSVPKNKQLLIKGSSFTANTAQIGGALYCNSTTAGLNVQNHFAQNSAAGNKDTNAEYCSKTCLTAFGLCGCMNGCGLPPPPSTATGTETKIALGIFIPITIILLGVVCFLLWKTNKNKQKLQQRAYDEIRLQPSSPQENDL
ncbi:hypothetical protein SAMD00019534_008270 [Acytostelium subglobosum LB1]|uniref:hypothetical protein n=1 Tax=Acytostelium subglobosum LB1 TaxID=1410327 RepID=UPI000644C8A0|nr:hypothetical protein SAMD00019534_008270 [Acytostelium subglobosum LB1]GAM17652.1 hypothetical protein SAMD00019534_008270 [Acytostelium subglobosum LB1]|eukprot:XP_012758248.1 hypothetical protein SAMD00019534_008270 [Acytostelium subglobosum LB1]